MTSIDLIRRVDAGKYRLDIHIDGRGHSFEFSVTQHQGIDVVNWSTDFAELMDRNFGKTDSLLASILAFHRAQDCELEC